MNFEELDNLSDELLDYVESMASGMNSYRPSLGDRAYARKSLRRKGRYIPNGWENYSKRKHLR